MGISSSSEEQGCTVPCYWYTTLTLSYCILVQAVAFTLMQTPSLLNEAQDLHYFLWEIIHFIAELHLLIQKPKHDDSEIWTSYTHAATQKHSGLKELT